MRFLKGLCEKMVASLLSKVKKKFTALYSVSAVSSSFKFLHFVRVFERAEVRFLVVGLSTRISALFFF